MIYTNITKGEALKLIMISSVAFTSATSYQIVPRSQGDLDGGTAQISKDGGSFGSLTNSGVFLGPGIWSIQLTADEMDADRIDVIYHDNSGDKFCGMSTIFTGAVGGGSGTGVSNFSPAFLDFMLTGLNMNYFMRKADLASSTYNYYGLSKSGSVWVIVRENKSSLALEYAVNGSGVNDRRFLPAWSQRVNLNYTGSAPF